MTKPILILCLLLLFRTLPAQKAHQYDGTYEGTNLIQLAFPIGGLGAGMFCIEGTGAISHLSVCNEADLGNEPNWFAAISIKDIPNSAKVLEGPVLDRKKYSSGGAMGRDWGLPRFRDSRFLARFPFAEIELIDNTLPLSVQISGWSPFIPTDADNSGLPVGALEYHFKNTEKVAREYIFSYNCGGSWYNGGYEKVRPIAGGFDLMREATEKEPEKGSDFCIFTDEKNAVVNSSWFRGGGFYGSLTMAWRDIAENRMPSRPPGEEFKGASLFVPFTLQPGEEKTIRVMMAWYSPQSRESFGGGMIGKERCRPGDYLLEGVIPDTVSRYYRPWYSNRFKSIDEVEDYWRQHYDELHSKTVLFRDAFYRSTLPPEVVEAVAANLTILKSPTLMRQYDGRPWGWEGCGEQGGNGIGTCNHVYNYAQSISHLFPKMERSFRVTEFLDDESDFGAQRARAAMPIVAFPADGQDQDVVDGQMGDIIKCYREWRISGDSTWLRCIYPRIQLSMDFCIRSYDSAERGVLDGIHGNTYDVPFFGPDGLINNFYLSALEALIRMGQYLAKDMTRYQAIFSKCKAYNETRLFNGEYFFQQKTWPDWSDVQKKKWDRLKNPDDHELYLQEGPEYQYYNGCLSDGVLGCWMAQVAGLDDPLDPHITEKHLLSVYKYNYWPHLYDHVCPQRPAYALGRDGGLVLCSWPHGGMPSIPFVYSNEIWTGIEYQVASHLMMIGHVKEGLSIVRSCRDRYDGRSRNPFDECEYGHWYARAMSSYALLQGLTGVRYDAVDQTLYVHSQVGDFVSFLSTDTGFGNVIYKHCKIKLNVLYGTIPVKHFEDQTRK